MKYDCIKDVFKLEDGKLFRFHGTKKLWTEVKNRVNHSEGYCLVGFKGKTVLYHRVVYCLHHKQDIDVKLTIDHINGNKVDNRIENLRLVSKRENSQNKSNHREGKLVGTTWNTQASKWQSQIRPCGSSSMIHLGLFSTQQIAHEHYMKAVEWVHLLRPNMSKECRKYFRNFIKSFF